MRILRPGIAYELANTYRRDQPGQILNLAVGSDNPGEIEDGTYEIEIIEALIDALYEKVKIVPTQNYNDAINSLEDARHALLGYGKGHNGAMTDPEGPAVGQPEGPDVVHQPEP